MRQLRERALKLITDGRASLRREWHTALLTGGVCALVPVFAFSVLALPPGAVEDIAGPVLGHSSIAAQLEEETGASRILSAGGATQRVGEGSWSTTAWIPARRGNLETPIGARSSRSDVDALHGGVPCGPSGVSGGEEPSPSPASGRYPAPPP